MLSDLQALGEELRGTGVTAATLCPIPMKTGFVAAAGISNAGAEPSVARKALTNGRLFSGGPIAQRTITVRGHAEIMRRRHHTGSNFEISHFPSTLSSITRTLDNVAVGSALSTTTV